MVVSLSILIPTLNEAAGIEAVLKRLQPLREQGAEIIVADGGSRDNTRALVEPYVDKVIDAPRGRALQMNAAAIQARGFHLMFLHADTQLPDGFSPQCLMDCSWGFFPVKLAGSSWQLRVIEWCMNVRSTLTGIGTGDQVLFVHRSLFETLGGYASIPLMEDVEFCGRLKSQGRPTIYPDKVITSSRRWEQAGTIRTVLKMWKLRLAYFLGASPERLAQQYYPK